MRLARRAVILPVVLMVLMLLGLLCAMFAFRVNADLCSTQAISFRLQTRLAAEAGVDRVKLLLRGDAKFDVDQWYHNPEELHRIVVWVRDFDNTELGTNQEYDGPAMAYRFSIVADDPTDDEERIRIGISDEAAKLNLNTATERQLRVLVRAAIGEENEESEEFTPQDIVDAILDWRDPDRKPRGEAGDTEGDYYRRLPQPYKVKNGPFDTVEELLLVKGVTGQILYGEDFDRNGLLTPNEDDGEQTFPPDNEDNILNLGLYPYLTVLSKENNVSNANRQRVHLYGNAEALRAELEIAFPEDPDVVDYVVAATRSQGEGNKGPNNPGTGGDGQAPPDGSADTQGDENEGDKQGPGGATDEENDGNDPPETGSAEGSESDDGQGTPAPMPTVASLLRDQIDGENLQRSPVTLEHLPTLLDVTTPYAPDQKTIPGLININTAPGRVLRCLEGAGGEPALSPEQIEAILEARERVPSEDKVTPAWLLMEEVLDLDTFELIAPQITARGQQFRIEALGYGDHVGMVTRLQVVVDAVGPIVQTIYYRDLTYLGGRFPIREEDLERIRVH